MNRLLKPACLLLTALIVSLSLVSSANALSYWQLTFSYDQNQLTIVDAAPIPPLRKEIHTPGLIGAPVKLAYDLDWLDDNGQVLLSTHVQLPLGMRATLADGGPCEIIIPESGTFVVRLEGVESAQLTSAIRMSRTDVMGRAAGYFAVPPAFVSGPFELPLPEKTDGMNLLDGPLGVTKIRDTGDDDNRLVLVVMGDGYTIDNLNAGDFEADAANLVSAFGYKEPWDVLFEATNVYRIDVESNEEGADNDPYGTYVDTYLNASFWVNDIERLLALTGTGYSRAYDAANSLVGTGVWDIIFVMVNSTKYGGSGGGIAVSSVHSAASEIILHEHGHSFGDLADEYETPYPGYPPGDGEPNVDFDYEGPGLKWLIWVEPGTPLPTPNSTLYDDVVGAFEGARYLSTGIYRPWYNCLMRSLGPDFGPICQQAQVLEFFGYVDMADDLAPPPSTPQLILPGGNTFTITPIPFAGITYEWRLAGEPLAGATGPEILLTPQDFADHGVTTGMLEVELEYPTPLVRGTQITEAYSWTVETACYCGAPGDVDGSGGAPTPLDVSFLVQKVFQSNDALYDYRVIGNCPYENGDVDGSGGAPNPLDVSYLVQRVFKSNDALCPDRCAGCGP